MVPELVLGHVMYDMAYLHMYVPNRPVMSVCMLCLVDWLWCHKGLVTCEKKSQV
jgi:hypothetical protein